MATITKIVNYLLIEEENDIYTIRMTPELQDDVGTIGFINFTQDDKIKTNEIIVNLEASKTVMGIVSPLAGRILERNEAACVTPTLLNSEKSTENWLITMTDVNKEAFNALEDA